LSGGRRLFSGRQLHEREPAGAPAVAVGGYGHADYFACFCEEFPQLLWSRVEAQIADEKFGLNGFLLSLVRRLILSA